MKRVLITGATGFIGRHLVRALVERGDQVTVLSRDPEQVSAALGTEVQAASWDPGPRAKRVGGEPWFSQLNGQDAVVHLAGQQAVGKRYTESVKRCIYDSRIESTLKLVEAIAE